MRGRGRFQYVDQFRKINCLQKLMKIENYFPDDRDDVKQDNNKFIRYKEENSLEQFAAKQEDLFNPIIDIYTKDMQETCQEAFMKQGEEVAKGTVTFQGWSHELNQEIKLRNYNYKFHFQSAQPPPRLKAKEQSQIKQKVSTMGQQPVEKTSREIQNTQIQLAQTSKYDFYQITRKLYNNFDLTSKQNIFMRDLVVKNQIVAMRQLKNLQAIDAINGDMDQLTRFNYDIELRSNYCVIQHIESSVVRGKNKIPIEYFRDIGLPSRNLAAYTKQNYFTNKTTNNQQIGNQFNAYQGEMCYLYHLKEDQLKINKSSMNFFDVANITMGRITPNNGHMCVRSEKVTQAQIKSLLQKLQKYDLRQKEKGNPRQHKAVGTEQMQQQKINDKNKKAQEHSSNDSYSIENIIKDIDCMRKQINFMQDKNTTNITTQGNFQLEVFVKMEVLLIRLLDSVTENTKFKYTLSQIGDHLDEIRGSNEMGYERMRLLWYIATCYDQMMKRERKLYDLRHMEKDDKHVMTVTKYKDFKFIKKESTQPKTIYSLLNKNEKDKKKSKSKSKSPLKMNKSNLKLNKSNIQQNRTFIKTPIKQKNNTPASTTAPRNRTTTIK